MIEHNKDSSKTWTQGVNQFSDWTHEEFKAFNTFKYSEAKAGAPVHEADPSFTVPDVLDYRTHEPAILTPIKNQESCGGCWAFGTAEVLESLFALKYGKLEELSTQQ